MVNLNKGLRGNQHAQRHNDSNGSGKNAPDGPGMSRLDTKAARRDTRNTILALVLPAMKTNSATLLFQYWDTLRGQRAAPERGEIEPGAVRHALLDTFILEVVDDSLVFRLAGTRLCAIFGTELKGKTFTSLVRDPATRVELSRMVDAVMDDSAGAVTGLTAANDDGDIVELELLVLPLRHGGKTHVRVMGVLAPIERPGWLGQKPVVDATVRSMRIIWSAMTRPPQASPEARRARLTVVPGGRGSGA